MSDAKALYGTCVRRAGVALVLAGGLLLASSLVEWRDDDFDDSAYIARNERVLDALPPYPGSRLLRSYSTCYTSSCHTLRIYRIPFDASPARVARFYRQRLDSSWHVRPGTGSVERSSTTIGISKGDACITAWIPAIAAPELHVRADHLCV